MQVHTPPDSNKSIPGCGGEESGLTTILGSIGSMPRTNSRTSAVRPEELSKMFPTPPSLEHNPQPSPVAFTLPEPEHQPSLHLRCGSPPDEPIEVCCDLIKYKIHHKLSANMNYFIHRIGHTCLSLPQFVNM